MPTCRPTVVLVEDQAPLAMMYQLGLTIHGFSTAVAETGRGGVHLAVELAPDAVVLDFELPDISGVAVLRLLQGDRRTRAIPVVMLSNRDDDAIVRTALGLGARAFLLKSATAPRDLARALEDLFAAGSTV
jgi:DNA-binding response OmpR family regulator